MLKQQVVHGYKGSKAGGRINDKTYMVQSVNGTEYRHNHKDRRKSNSKQVGEKIEFVGMSQVSRGYENVAVQLPVTADV